MPSAMALGSRPTALLLAFSASAASKATRMDRIRAFGAMPMTPSALPVLSPWPAMMLAAEVPSIPQVMLAGVSVAPVKSGPVVTEPARSGWDASTPVLSSATVTPAPWEDCQAWVTCRRLSHHSARRILSPAAVPALAAPGRRRDRRGRRCRWPGRGRARGHDHAGGRRRHGHGQQRGARQSR